MNINFVEEKKLKLFTYSVHCFVSQADRRETEEFRLLRDLFKDYDKEVRPVYNTSEAVNVEFSLSLIQIISVVGSKRLNMRSDSRLMKKEKKRTFEVGRQLNNFLFVNRPDDNRWYTEIVVHKNEASLRINPLALLVSGIQI